MTRDNSFMRKLHSDRKRAVIVICSCATVLLFQIVMNSVQQFGLFPTVLMFAALVDIRNTARLIDLMKAIRED